MNQLLDFCHRFSCAIALLIFAFLAPSCADDPISHFTPPHEDELGSLYVSIQTPSDVAVRSGSATEENGIKRALLYIFDGAGNYHSHEEVEESNIDIAGGIASPVVYAQILSADDIPTTNTIVLILNHKKSEPTTPESVTLSTIDTHFTLGGGGAKGFENPKDGIPMYGEIDNWSTLTMTPMAVRRSVAKVLIQLKAGGVTGSNATGFTTTNVTYGLFNNAISGRLKDLGNGVISHSDANTMPFSATLSGSAIDKQTISTSTTFGAGSASYIYEYPYATRIIGTNAATDVAVSATQAKYNKDRLAIILKVSNVTPVRYYRLDLARQAEVDGTATYINVERNHQYRIVISEVNDDGYSTADEAIKGFPNNIIFTITDESNGDVFMSDNNKYGITIGREVPSATHIVPTNRMHDITVAKDVKYIYNPSYTGLPSYVTLNEIKVLDGGTGALLSVVATPNKLTGSGADVKIKIPASSSIATKTFKTRFSLGNLSHTSEQVHTVVYKTPFAFHTFTYTPAKVVGYELNSAGAEADMAGNATKRKIVLNNTVKSGETLFECWSVNTLKHKFFAAYPASTIITNPEVGYPTITYTTTEANLTQDLKTIAEAARIAQQGKIPINNLASKLVKIVINVKASQLRAGVTNVVVGAPQNQSLKGVFTSNGFTWTGENPINENQIKIHPNVTDIPSDKFVHLQTIYLLPHNRITSPAPVPGVTYYQPHISVFYRAKNSMSGADSRHDDFIIPSTMTPGKTLTCNMTLPIAAGSVTVGDDLVLYEDATKWTGTWDQAKARCANLRVDGRGWRIPDDPDVYKLIAVYPDWIEKGVWYWHSYTNPNNNYGGCHNMNSAGHFTWDNQSKGNRYRVKCVSTK